MANPKGLDNPLPPNQGHDYGDQPVGMGYVWCHTHRGWEYPAWRPTAPDDYIDFPCSPIFRDYYYERGLTPRPSGQCRSLDARPHDRYDIPDLESHNDLLVALEQEIAALRYQLRETQSKLAQIQRQGGQRPPYATARTDSPPQLIPSLSPDGKPPALPLTNPWRKGTADA
jgi:hypothetical protein